MPSRSTHVGTKNRLVVARSEVGGGVGEMGEGSQKIQTSRYIISKSCGYNVQHGNNYSYNTVLCIWQVLTE